jgi:hypothetical protein
MPYIKNFDYVNIPTLYEEAIVLYTVLTKRIIQEINIRSLSPNIFNKFIRYQNILAKYKGDKKLAQNEIYKNFGDTYWYYCMYLSKNPIRIDLK